MVQQRLEPSLALPLLSYPQGMFQTHFGDMQMSVSQLSFGRCQFVEVLVRRENECQGRWERQLLLAGEAS